MNPAHYTFTAIFIWNKTHYTDNCYTNIHIQCTTNYQLQLKPLRSSFYYRHAPPVLKPDASYCPVQCLGDLRIHPVKMLAMS